MKITHHIRQSHELLRSEFWLFAGLSTCLHVSFIASVCALGLIAGPWFACELIAFQLLGLGGMKRIERDRGWLVAGLLFLGLQMLILTGVVFAWIGLSTSAPLEGAVVANDAVAVRPLLVFVSTLIVSLGVTIPLTFVPHHLLSRKVGALQALGDGLRDVTRLGFVKVYRLVLLTQLFQLTPFLLMALFVTWIWGREAIPLGVLVLSPVQIVLLPFAQGVVSSVYVELSAEQQAAGQPARWLDVLALALPVVLCLLSVLSLLRPAPLTDEARFDGAEVFNSATDGNQFRAQGSDLAIRLANGSVYLETSDGGGAGRVGTGVRAMQIEERFDAFVAKLETDSGARALHFDRAGVRLDDSLSDRLAGHVPEWFFLLIMAAMLMSTWAVYRRKSTPILFFLVLCDLLVATITFFR